MNSNTWVMSIFSRFEAAMKASIPVVIHLDHGETMHQVIRAIRCGFTSVMIDASRLNYEKNIELTKEIVSIAKCVGVSVEAELGTIGNVGNNIEGGSEDIIFTDPDMAKDFVSRTEIDTFAVAIGTAHGLYPKDLEPKIRIDLLQKIKNKVSIPLVLHGGSSNTESELIQAVQSGICKINISSDIKSAFFRSARKVLSDYENAYEPNSIFVEPARALEQVVYHKLELFGAINKGDLY